MLYLQSCLSLCVILASGVLAFAQELNPEQTNIIRDTAASICNTVRDVKGQKSEVQIQGDVKATLSGVVKKLADLGVSGAGSLNREEFEGLSRDATATALEGDRGCRERVFNKMFDLVKSHGDQPVKRISGIWNNSSTGETLTIRETGDIFISSSGQARFSQAVTQGGANILISGSGFECYYYLTLLSGDNSMNLQFREGRPTAACAPLSGLYARVAER
jgi:hypothetical protein